MRRTLGLATLVLGVGLAWALWPVADPRWAIAVDASAARAAERFLSDARPAAPGEQPNVVVIVADDLGKYDTSLYGAGPVATPNLARLADGGVRFTAGYVTSPVCSPSRAALLTGRYAQRFGFELLTHDRYPRNRLEWWVARTFFSTHGWHALARPTAPSRADMERQGIPAGEITLAQLLRARGYRTGIFGKWHLGFGPGMLPAAKGFETHYGFYDAFSLYGDPDDPDLAAVRQPYFADRYQWWRGRSGGSAIRRNGTIVDEHEYLTAAIAREASAWIVEQRNAPFFAYVPFNAPHHTALFWRAGGHQAVRAGGYKLIRDDRTGARALYDLAEDPRERTDLAARDPERAAALARVLTGWESTLAPPRWPPAMEYRFTIGGQHFVFPL